MVYKVRENFDSTLKRKIFERDDWKCVRCLGAAQDIHHRKLRGLGGSKLLNTPANLISLCRRCHDWAHRNPTIAYDAGYLVHSWDDPETVFIITKLGVLTLRDDGTTDLQGSCGPLF